MNALRNINKQLETKSDDIKQKCEDLLFLQDKCAQLETKCDEQAKMLQMAEIERMKASYPEGYEQEIAKKYGARQKHRRNLEVAKLSQELQAMREEMQQLLEKKTEGQDRLLAVGSVRKDKELRQMQGEYELIKADLARLKGENQALKAEIGRRDEIDKHTNLSQRSRADNMPMLSPAPEDKARPRSSRRDPTVDEPGENPVAERAAPVPIPATAPKQSRHEQQKEEDLEGSVGSGTLRSGMSELTKSQRLIIENVFRIERVTVGVDVGRTAAGTQAAGPQH